MKIKLYKRTITKFPSHSIWPKSPSKSKFVIPEMKVVYEIRSQRLMIGIYREFSREVEGQTSESRSSCCLLLNGWAKSFFFSVGSLQTAAWRKIQRMMWCQDREWWKLLGLLQKHRAWITTKFLTWIAEESDCYSECLLSLSLSTYSTAERQCFDSNEQLNGIGDDEQDRYARQQEQQKHCEWINEVPCHIWRSSLFIKLASFDF